MTEEQIIDAVKYRIAHYEKKLSKADILSDDTMTRWEQLEHTVMALKYLLADIQK